MQFEDGQIVLNTSHHQYVFRREYLIYGEQILT